MKSYVHQAMLLSLITVLGPIFDWPAKGFASSPSSVKLLMEKENSMFLIDLHDANEGETDAREWTIETEQKDRIFFLTISTTDGSPLDQGQLRSLMIYDAQDFTPITFPYVTIPESESQMSSRSVYSTGNGIVINYYPRPQNKSNPQQLLQLKIEKAVNCPVNLGGSSSCGRITDQLSCYCATFANRTWEQTRAFCVQNGMRFAAIESYTEDMAIWDTWGGQEAFWIGLSDFVQEGKYIWEATGGLLSAGYQNWLPGQPDNAGEPGIENCGQIGFGNRLGWNDFICDQDFIGNQPLGGICEMQP